jgi:hypothetical protein
MKFQLKRVALKPGYTIGRYYIDREDGQGFQYLNDTLEPPRLPDGSTIKPRAIDPGNYIFTLEFSPKHGRIVPLLHDVRDFVGVEQHIGNYPHDTLGCQLFGYNREIGAVVNSTDAFEKYMKILQNSGQSQWNLEILEP